MPKRISLLLSEMSLANFSNLSILQITVGFCRKNMNKKGLFQINRALYGICVIYRPQSVKQFAELTGSEMEQGMAPGGG